MTVKRKDVSGHAASKKTGGDEKRVKSKHDSMDGSKKSSTGASERKKPFTKHEAKAHKEIPHNHKEQRDLKEKRQKLRNPNFDVVKQSKILWEKLRGRNCTKEQRKEYVTELLEILEGKLTDVILQHDSVRIVQCCMQYGTAEQRATIVAELLPQVIKLSMSTYGKHMVPKMLMYGTKEHKAKIIECFSGHVCKLIKHRTAAPVLAVAYADYANATQRAMLLREFYGPQFSVLKLAESAKSLDEIIEAKPEKKESILKHMKQTLTPLLEKGLCAHHIVHRALLDYLTHAPQDGPDVAEIIDAVKELLVEMLHTKDGAAVTARCIWSADAKTRKVIVKSFKDFVLKICQDEEGYLAMLALFDCVDDTVLLTKQIIGPIKTDLETIATNKYGIKVLLYLLAPRSRKYFMPDLMKRLEGGDGNPHSKKDTTQRQQELRTAVLPVLGKFARQHVASMVGVGPRTQLLYEILSAMHDDDAHVDTVDMLIDATAQTVRPGSITSDENDAAVASDDIASTYRRLDVDCHVDTMRYRLNLVLLLGSAAGCFLAQRLLGHAGLGKKFAGVLHREIQAHYTWADLATSSRACFVLLDLCKGEFEGASAPMIASLQRANLKLEQGDTNPGLKRLLELIASSDTASSQPVTAASATTKTPKKSKKKAGK